MEILVLLVIAAVATAGALFILKAVNKSKERSTPTEPKTIYYTPDVTEYTAPSSSAVYPDPVITDKERDYTRPTTPKAKPRSSSSSRSSSRSSYGGNSAATNAAIFGGSSGSYSSDSGGSSYSSGSDSGGGYSGGCDSGGGSF